MLALFITNIQKESQAEQTVQLIQAKFLPDHVNYDMDETGLPFPCGHTVLRVEGANINAKEILTLIRAQNVRCEIMEDRSCA